MHQQQNSKQKSNNGKETKTEDDNDEGDYIVAFNKTIPIKQKLKEYAGDFDQTAFSELLTRKDLSHLLLTDIQDMMQMLANEFPEIVTIKTIGKTWEGRPIDLIQLDARQMMQDKGVNEDIVEILPPEKRKVLAQKPSDDDDDSDDKKKSSKTEDLSESELLEKNEDINRNEVKAVQAKTDAFNAIPQDQKENAIADQIGMDLIQIKQSLVSQRESESLLQTGEMEQQIFDQKQENTEEEMSISDMTNKAKEEMAPKKKEEPKKEVKKEDDGTSDDFAEGIAKDLENASKDKKSQSLAEEKTEEAKDDKKLTESKPEVAVKEEKVQTPSAPVKASAIVKEEKKETKKDAEEEPKKEEKPKSDDGNIIDKDIKIVTPEMIGKKPVLKEIVKAVKKGQKDIIVDPNDRAIMITGETHARELLSAQVPLFLCLKLIHQGVMHDREKYQKILRNQRFYFLPVLNVDGAAVVEQHWLSEGKILNKRKNMNPNYQNCGEENAGVDLNRNFGIDWQALHVKNKTELCGDFWPGDSAFSEPESRALRDFVAEKKEELKFIINCHTSGNEFIWPYNGREPNDIETRSPGYLAMFQDIAKNAPFPDGVMKGNSYEVIGDKMGGDQDDFLMGTYGVPSVTSEMGFFGQYIQDWRCQSKGVCYEIIRENTRWMEYIMQHIGKISQIVVPK